jgi:hypothetical protein
MRAQTVPSIRQAGSIAYRTWNEKRKCSHSRKLTEFDVLALVERYSHKEKRDGSKFVFSFFVRRSGRFDRDDFCSMLRHHRLLR